jgi:hypothetical protein
MKPRFLFARQVKLARPQRLKTENLCFGTKT